MITVAVRFLLGEFNFASLLSTASQSISFLQGVRDYLPAKRSAIEISTSSGKICLLED
jgi:hypothetical protein